MSPSKLRLGLFPLMTSKYQSFITSPILLAIRISVTVPVAISISIAVSVSVSFAIAVAIAIAVAVARRRSDARILRVQSVGVTGTDAVVATVLDFSIVRSV